jgi:hypothetical protein
VLSWSSGKDSAWALHLLRHEQNVRVIALLTAFNGAADRVAMHAVRRTLVEQQAQRTGLPLWQIPLPWPCCVRAKVTCVDPKKLDQCFAGREFDMKLLADLPGFVFADVLPREPEGSVAPGLCGACQNARTMRSDRGSVFHRCLLADKDARFAKYPRLPVVRCVGWEPVGA